MIFQLDQQTHSLNLKSITQTRTAVMLQQVIIYSQFKVRSYFVIQAVNCTFGQVQSERKQNLSGELTFEQQECNEK